MLVGEVFARMGLDSKQYEKGLGKLEGMTQKKAVTLGSIFKGAFSFALGMGLISGFRSLGGAITDFVNTAARTEALDVAMQSVAKSSGYAIAALREQRKSVMELGIAEQEATQILTRFMQAQLDTADAAKLARVAQDAAVISGTNSSQAAEQMTEAIAKQRPMLLAQFGMMAGIEEMYGEYAKAVGKASSQLTQAEKKQAMLNYILKEGEKIAGTYEASMGAVGKQIGSLPRYWDTLKNAIAKPLALPAISVIVDGITNSLKNAISWAEANTMTLQRWGQTAANVADYVVKGFQFVTRTFVENWGMIRFAATALLTYAVATRTAAGATALFQMISLALNGQLAAKIPLLGFVSTAMGIYKVQMALASAQGIVLSGVLAKVRVALYSVWTALGPIGWAILLISGLIAGGMALWNKYTQSLQKATQAASPADLAKGFRDLEKSTQKSANATEEQADALTEAGKAAGKNIQSFDEVHQLQEDMAGSGEDMALDVPGLEDIGMPELPDMGLGDMMAGLEPVKGTLRGLWDWIKESAGNVWDSVKQKWSIFINWVKSWAVWDWIGQKWQALKDVAITVWNAIATTISNVWNWLSGLVSGIFGPIGEFISTTWENLLTTTVDIWDSIWTTLSTIWNDLLSTSSTIFEAIWTFISETWNNLWSTASEVWNSIWTFLSDLWNNIWTTASDIWQAIADLITGKIDLRTAVVTIWNAIKDFFSSTWNSIKTMASGIWGAIAEFIFGTWLGLKTAAETIWNAIATFFSNTWNSIKSATENIWNAIKTFLITTWENLKQTALTVWQTIEQYIVDPIRRAWNILKEIWGNIKSYILSKWDEIKQGITNTAQSLIDAIKSPFIKAKEWILGLIEEAKEWGKNLINNIIDGIKSTAGKIKDTVLGIFSGGSSSGGGKSGGTIRGFSSKEQEKGYDKKMRDAGAPSWLFHDGGWVGTSGSRKFDEIMALLQTGEFVVSRKMIENIERAMPKIQASPTPAMTTAPVAPEIHLHVGALIADDYSLKKLEQRLRNIRIYEDQRVGDTR